MKYLLLCALVALGLSLPMDSPDDEYQWELFKLEHEREYQSKVEEQQRKNIFLSNLKFVREHNAKYERGEVTFDVEINRFGDMTTKEFSEMMTGVLMPIKYKSSGNEFALGDSSDLPKSLDWRKKGAVAHVKDQGRCASSWAFCALGALEGQWFLKKKKLVSLSEQNLLDCSSKYGNYGCEGGLITSAFKYVMSNDGVDTEESYPYEGQTKNCRYSIENKGATARRLSIVYDFDDPLLRKLVANVGPVAEPMDANHTSFQFYRKGVYMEPDCSTTEINHGVLLIGYGTAIKGGDYWIFKNSWGTGWGMEGYFMMARNNENMCGIGTQNIFPGVYNNTM